MGLAALAVIAMGMGVMTLAGKGPFAEPKPLQPTVRVNPRAIDPPVKVIPIAQPVAKSMAEPVEEPAAKLVEEPEEKPAAKRVEEPEERPVQVVQSIPLTLRSRPRAGRRIMTTTPPSGPALPPLRKPRIVIEKSKRRLTVFDGTTLVKQYAVIVGTRVGDKRVEGDFRTPEGEFYVCVKNPRSKFTLSLGLNYPRASDARRGQAAGLITARQCQQIVEANARNRQPLWNTKLGGEIMIHGKRRDTQGNPRPGTLGCIAMDDANIRELYPRIPPGTIVIIKP
jgi:lipoprotein-anchoring transpeptidase ErfK/SrfK